MDPEESRKKEVRARVLPELNWIKYKNDQGETDLNLPNFCQYSVESMEILFEALQEAPTIKTLCLGNPYMGRVHVNIPREVDEQGIIAIAGFLKTNTTLTSLAIETRSIESKGVTALVGALIENYTLTQLKISAWCIGEKSEMHELAQLIRSITFRLITPELLVISNTSHLTSQESHLELKAAFTDHANTCAAFIKKALFAYFPEPLARLTQEYIIPSTPPPPPLLISIPTQPIEDRVTAYTLKPKRTWCLCS